MFDKEEIQQLKDIFATKDDLKSFATKDDLKSFATKDDLKSFATKDDLKSFATKDYVDERLKNQTMVLMDAMDEKIKDVKDDVREIKENVGLILKSLDVDVSKKSTRDQEQAMISNKVDRHEKWITQIAKKVDLKLES